MQRFFPNNTISRIALLSSLFLSLPTIAQGQLGTDFSAQTQLSTTIPVILKWGHVPDIQGYKIVEQAHGAAEYLEKAYVVDSEVETHSYGFELTRPQEGVTENWAYKIIACLIHEKTSERLCESVAQYTQPVPLQLTKDSGFEPIEIFVQFDFDELGRLTDMQDPKNGDRGYQYDAAGNRTQLNVLDNAN